MTDGFERADVRLGEGLKEQDAKIDRNQTVVEQVRVRGAAAACVAETDHSSLAAAHCHIAHNAWLISYHDLWWCR